MNAFQRRTSAAFVLLLFAGEPSLGFAQSIGNSPVSGQQPANVPPPAAPGAAPVRLSATLVGKLKADGRTPASLRIEVLDALGHDVPAAAVRVQIVDGEARFERLATPRDAYQGVTGFANPFDLQHLPVFPLPGGIGELAPSPAPAPLATGQPSYPAPNANTPNAVAAQTAIAAPSSVTAPAFVPSAQDNSSVAQSIDVVLPKGGGTLDLPIYPGTLAGPVRVRLSCANLSTDYTFSVAPSYRRPLVAGLVTAGLGSVPAPPGSPDNAPDGLDTRRGRVAVYGTGAVMEHLQFSLAYDTANTLQQSPTTGSFIFDPNDRPFSTYGDSSIRYNDALSRDHLFARLESGDSSLGWGEFLAQTGTRDGVAGDGFNLLLDGLQASARLTNGRASLTAFNANNDVAYDRIVYNPTGLASPGFRLRGQVVLGSDIITLVSFDRRTGAPIAQRTLTRNVDYTLDYETGQLYFINVPLRFDDNFNPQSVLIQYQYQGMGSATASGGRLDVALDPKQLVHLGVGYANYAAGSNNTTFGQDLNGSFNGGTWSFAHETGTGYSSFGVPAIARNGSLPSQSGDMWRAGVNLTRAADTYQLAFTTTGVGYTNPFGGISTPGFSNYLALWRHRFSGDLGDFALQYDAQNNANSYVNYGGNTSQAEISALLHRRVAKRLIATAGLSQHGYSGSQPISSQIGQQSVGPAAAGLQGTAGLDYRVAPTVDVSLQRLFNFSGNNLSQPSQTSAQLNVDFAGKGRAYVRQLWSDAPTIPFANNAQTSPYTPNSPTLAAASKASTAVGFERAVGTNTTIDTEYVLENTGSGSDIYSAIGVHERFTLTPYFSGDASFQHANAIGYGALGFNAYGLSLTTTDKSRVRASTSIQERTGDQAGFTAQAGAAGAVSPDFSVLGSLNMSRVLGYSYDQGRFGVAYRPAHSDWGATLLEYDVQSGSFGQVFNGPFSSAQSASAETLALSHTWDWSTRFVFAARYAFKLDGEGYYPTHSDLFGARADQRIGPRFDIGSEVAYLRSANASAVNTTTFAAEAGYRLGGATRLAGGYNFTGSPDPTLSNSTTHRGLYMTITSTVDRVFGWGAQR